MNNENELLEAALKLVESIKAVDPAAPCSALLESRHETFLQWCEPWPSCGPEGNDLDAHVVLCASVHDCINLQRRVAKASGRPTMGDDKNHLLDFIAIHWARVVDDSSHERATQDCIDDIVGMFSEPNKYADALLSTIYPSNEDSSLVQPNTETKP
jgi:hypothetical protein